MKVALLFPGYTSQFVGMGKELYDEYRIVQEYFEEASNCANVNFVKLCFASSDTEISKLAHAYMSLFLIGCCVSAVLKEQGIVPDVVAGYNNGEITSLFAGGCFSLPDGLYLLNKFCSFYQETADRTDISLVRIIGATTQELQVACKRITQKEDELTIAFYNDEKDHIVIGLRDHINQLQTLMDSHSNNTFDYVASEVGLHSHLMNDVIDQFKIYLEKVDFKDITIPMISGIDGALVTNGDDIKDRFIRHFVTPFRFDLILPALHEYDIILVSAPAAALSTMVRDYYPDKTIVMIEKKGDIDTIKEMIGIKSTTE